MDVLRSVRVAELASLAVTTAALVAALLQPGAAVAFQIQDRGTTGLDGKVVMSPAAERVETVRPDGGDQVGPGVTVNRSVILHNRSEVPVQFDLDVAEVVGSDSELVVEVRHGVRGGAAAWVTLERTSFSLKPGQQATIGVKIAIPAGVKPGSKPFAVTATQRGGAVQTQGAGIAPQFKQVGIFIVELPGDAASGGKLTKASITSAQKRLAAARDGGPPPSNARVYVSPKLTGKHRLTLSTEYDNSGERLLTPTGSVVIKDIFGRTAGTFEIDRFTVYPGGQASGTVELKGLPSLGIFQARVELESVAGTQSTTLPRFVMIPKWFIIAAVAFLLYGAFRLLKRQLRRRREWRQYLADGASSGDDAASDPDWVEGEGDGSDEDGAWSYGGEAERA